MQARHFLGLLRAGRPFATMASKTPLQDAIKEKVLYRLAFSCAMAFFRGRVTSALTQDRSPLRYSRPG